MIKQKSFGCTISSESDFQKLTIWEIIKTLPHESSKKKPIINRKDMMGAFYRLVGLYHKSLKQNGSSILSGSIVAAILFIPYAAIEILGINTGIGDTIDAIFTLQTFMAIMTAWFMVLAFGFCKHAMKAADALVDSLLFGTSFLCVILLLASMGHKAFEDHNANIQENVVQAISTLLVSLVFFVAISPINEAAKEKKNRKEQFWFSVSLIAFGMSLPFILMYIEPITWIIRLITYIVAIPIYYFIVLIAWLFYYILIIIAGFLVTLFNAAQAII